MDGCDRLQKVFTIFKSFLTCINHVDIDLFDSGTIDTHILAEFH